MATYTTFSHRHQTEPGLAWSHLAVDWRDRDVVITLHTLQPLLEPHQSSDYLLVVARYDLQLVFGPADQNLVQGRALVDNCYYTLVRVIAQEIGIHHTFSRSPSDTINSSSSSVRSLDLRSSSLPGKMFCTTCNINVVLQVWRVIKHLANPPDGEDVAEHHVTHDGVDELQSLLLLLIKQHQPVQLEGRAVWPGQPRVLGPPPGHHCLHEEP